MNPWVGWMNSPLVSPFLANSESELAELVHSRTQSQHPPSSCRRENSANPKRKSRLGGSHPKDVVRPVAQEVLQTTYAKPYGQKKEKSEHSQASHNSSRARPIPEAGHMDRDSRRRHLLTGESRRNLRKHEQMPNKECRQPKHCWRCINSKLFHEAPLGSCQWRSR